MSVELKPQEEAEGCRMGIDRRGVSQERDEARAGVAQTEKTVGIGNRTWIVEWIQQTGKGGKTLRKRTAARLRTKESSLVSRSLKLALS